MLDPMSETARAFWTVAPGRGELREETLAAPGPGDVVVDTLYSGISRGTESTVFHGRVPPEEYQRMRAPFQAGDFPGPLKYGYASVGRVVHGPEELRWTGARYRALTGDVQQAHATVGWRTVGPLHPDTPALDVASAVLSAANAGTAAQARSAANSGIKIFIGAIIGDSRLIVKCFFVKYAGTGHGAGWPA